MFRTPDDRLPKKVKSMVTALGLVSKMLQRVIVNFVV